MLSLKDDLAIVHNTTDWHDLISRLGIKTEAGHMFFKHAIANTLLFDRKQQDYGPRNISGFGTFGVVVRMNDKHERLKTLFAKKKNRAVNESIEDTLRDISNYAIIASMIERGEWPNE